MWYCCLVLVLRETPYSFAIFKNDAVDGDGDGDDDGDFVKRAPRLIVFLSHSVKIFTLQY